MPRSGAGSMPWREGSLEQVGRRAENELRSRDRALQKVGIHVREVLGLVVADPVVEMHDDEDEALRCPLMVSRIELSDRGLQRR